MVEEDEEEDKTNDSFLHELPHMEVDTLKKHILM